MTGTDQVNEERMKKIELKVESPYMHHQNISSSSRLELNYQVLTSIVFTCESLTYSVCE
jgi:hypothetical protein